MSYPILKLLRQIITPEGRLQVDVGSSGLSVRYRAFYEYSVPAGESRWIRLNFPSDVTVTSMILDNDLGVARLRAWRGATGIGPWSAMESPLSGLFASNNSGGAGGQPSATVELGGDGSVDTIGGIVSLVTRARSSSSNKTAVSIGKTVTDELVAAAGEYFVQIESLESMALEGVFSIEFEERTV
ncbi:MULTISPECIES: hypothetical protein [unclassified Halomonas]|uniref:hypothetical protein n=1 Tax=unclassified Halomonas TaxID=2609666 RepID=UPI00207674F2|nr:MULTISPECIES: hypothetical protein [unclassified Halomonas]